MNIYRKLPPEFADSAAELFAEAFEDKFSYFLGSKASIQKIIPCLLNEEQVIVAVSQTRELLGIAGFSYKEKHMLSISIKAMIKQYGWIKGLYKTLQLSIYLPNEWAFTYLYVDAIAVKAGHRGKGISRLLINELDQIATEKGLTHLQLDVSDNNRSAIVAYERAGFHLIKSEELPHSISKRIGILRVNRMLRILNQYFLDPKKLFNK